MTSKLAVRSVQVGIPLFLLCGWSFLRKLPRNATWARGLPILGRLLDVWKSLKGVSMHDDYFALHKQLGKTFAYHVVGQPFVATTDPAVIEHILKKKFENYIKGSAYRTPFTELLGDGIFNVDGHLWTHQRKTSSKMFTKKQFETHIIRAVQNNTQKVCEVLAKSGGKDFCMFELMNRFTLDTIGEIGFSKNIGSIEDPTSPFLKSFDFAQQSLLKRFWLGQGGPWWKVLRAFGIAWESELPAHFRMLNDYCNGIVDELVEKVGQGDDNSFVGMFIKDPEGANMLRTDEKKFRIYIRDMVLNFLIAGRDTTAQCLTWTLLELAQAPHVVAKARAEIEEVCGDDAIQYNDLTKLRYINAVLHEGLRLHPSVPMDAKLSVEQDTLPNGIVIEAGTIVHYNAFAQGRSKDIWGEDAEVFRPERWLERAAYPSSFEFSAFHAGNRECLGRRLAIAEMTTFVSTFLRDFDFELAVAAHEVKYDVQLTLGCSTGMPVRVTPRKTAN